MARLRISNARTSVSASTELFNNTVRLQMNGAVSKINKKFISHLTRAQRTPSAAATLQVSHALPAVRFSCLLPGPRGQFTRWRRGRKRLSVCSVLRCPDLWLQCSVSFVHGLEKTHHAWCTHGPHRKPFPPATPSWKLAPQPRSKHERANSW